MDRQAALGPRIQRRARPGQGRPGDQAPARQGHQRRRLDRPAGRRHTPLVVNDQIVGNLWEQAGFPTLEVAAYWAAPFGVKAELTHDKKIVGMLWVNV
ncbi:MAG: hypothetical protein M0Z42_16075 [Actinomycetota bacterium]|jgi:hypothetical protein|nr:hypothetical protein [Actinomycetota bacterium]